MSDALFFDILLLVMVVTCILMTLVYFAWEAWDTSSRRLARRWAKERRHLERAQARRYRERLAANRAWIRNGS